MLNFIKNVFKSKERIKDRDSYKIRDALLRKISLTQKIGRDNNGMLAGRDLNITNQYTVDYVQQLEQELAIGKQEDGLTNARFNQIESTYEKAKRKTHEKYKDCIVDNIL